MGHPDENAKFPPDPLAGISIGNKIYPVAPKPGAFLYGGAEGRGRLRTLTIRSSKSGISTIILVDLPRERSRAKRVSL